MSKQYTLGQQPKHKTGFWVRAAGYLWWHRYADIALCHAARIVWTDQVSVWEAGTGKVI